MPTPTFLPLRAPKPGNVQKPKLKLRKAEFGDGYTQSSPDGLNHIRKVWSGLEWDLLTPTEAKVFTDFFEERGGYKAFMWTPSDETTPIRVKCEEWDDKRDTGGLRVITATFEQDFGLSTD